MIQPQGRRPPAAGPLLLAAAGLGALALGGLEASAGHAAAPAPVDPVQVVADIVLIEAECRQLNVDYGKLFAYARANGIDPVDIMPLGARRAAFDADYRRRARDAKGGALCGALAAERDATVPGVFTPR